MTDVLEVLKASIVFVLMKGGSDSSDMSVGFYQIARRNIARDNNLLPRRSKNLKFSLYLALIRVCVDAIGFRICLLRFYKRFGSCEKLFSLLFEYSEVFKI